MVVLVLNDTRLLLIAKAVHALFSILHVAVRLAHHPLYLKLFSTRYQNLQKQHEQEDAKEESEEGNHRMAGPEDDVRGVLMFLALNMDQFRYVHFEDNFLALPDTYPAK